MPKSEDNALYSFFICTATFMAFRRTYKWLPLTRTRLVGGFGVFAAWQRYLASGGWTYTIKSNQYVPTEPPEKEQKEHRLPHWNQMYAPGCDHMYNQTALITGVSKGGIGFYTAASMYRMGANIVITTRTGDKEKKEELARDIRQAAAIIVVQDGVPQMTLENSRITVIELDYSKEDLVDEVQSVVRQLDERGIGELDVLVNNAGAFFQLGAEQAPRFHGSGVELSTAINTVGPMLLTEALKPRIATRGRIVHVASDAHRQIKSAETLSGLMHGRAVSRSAFDYYAASKFCNIAYAAHQNRVDPKHTHVAVHPGVSMTNLFRDVASMQFFRGLGLDAWLEGVTLLVCKSPKEAAYTSLYAAVDPYVPGLVREKGEFYAVDCKPGGKYLSRMAANVDVQEEVCKELDEIVKTMKERKRKSDLRTAAA